MSHHVTIRRSLVRNLVLIIVLLGGAVMATTFIGSRGAVRTLSGALITRTVEAVESRLDGFFDPVRDQLLLARAWGAEGLIDVDHPVAVEQLFAPVIRQHPQVCSVIVAADDGRECMILRLGEAWSCRVSRPAEWGRVVEWRRWTDTDPTVRVSREELDYDARRRPWFIGAMAARDQPAPPGRPRDPVHWTTPYTFFTTKEPGITASATCVHPDGHTLVVGFDMLLANISAFTRELRVTSHGMVFVLAEDLGVIGLPAIPRYDDPQAQAAAFLRTPLELGLPVAADAARAFGTAAPPPDEPTSFRSGGHTWWGQVRAFPLAPDRLLWTAVVVPESDLVGGFAARRAWIAGIVLAVLGGAILRALALARRYSRPIEALVAQSDRIRGGDFEPGPRIETEIAEVRRLADAHDRMRTGLHSLLKLERDLQLARQIQQSTFPDRLPELAGFDIAAWSEPADETGGDTFDVIAHTVDVTGPPERRAPASGGERAVFLLADATGHGIGPALSVTQIRAMLRMAVRLGGELEAIARHMNEQLCSDLPSARFITAWLGELDTRAGTLRSFSAGQAPLIHYRAAANTVDVANADAPPFGILEDLAISVKTISLAPGDLFAVISDGFLEATSPAGRWYGTPRAGELIRANHDAPAARIIEALRTSVEEFTAGAPADDDRTAIVIRRT